MRSFGRLPLILGGVVREEVLRRRVRVLREGDVVDEEARRRSGIVCLANPSAELEHIGERDARKRARENESIVHAKLERGRRFLEPHREPRPRSRDHTSVDRAIGNERAPPLTVDLNSRAAEANAHRILILKSRNR